MKFIAITLKICIY